MATATTLAGAERSAPHTRSSATAEPLAAIWPPPTPIAAATASASTRCSVRSPTTAALRRPIHCWPAARPSTPFPTVNVNAADSQALNWSATACSGYGSDRDHRPQGDGCDMGSVESTTPLAVTLGWFLAAPAARPRRRLPLADRQRNRDRRLQPPRRRRGRRPHPAPTRR